MKFESNGAAAAWGNVDVTNAHAGTRAEIRLESSDARSTFVLVVSILLASCGGTPTAPPPSILSLGGVPATATAGVPIAAVVTANDGFGAPFAGYRGSVHFSSTDPGAILPPDYTFTAADAGKHDFTDELVLKKAGPQGISVSDVAGGSSASSSPVIVVAGPAAAFAVVLPEPSMTAGVPGNLSVKAVDAFGNTADYSGNATVASSDPRGTVPRTLDFTAGTARDTLISFKTAGTQSIALTDSSNALIFGGALIAVLPAAASNFDIVQMPPRVDAGESLFLRVRAHDDFGNDATSYRGPAAVSSTDDQAALPPPLQFIGGEALASLVFKTAGPQSLTVADGPSLTATVTTIIAPSVIATFAIGPATSPVVAGTETTFTITARDRFRNVATGYVGAPGILSSDLLATLPRQPTLTGGIAIGVPITFKTAGPQSVTANDGTITGSANVTVAPGPAKRFVVSGLPASLVAGSAATFGLSALDDFGNLATAYGGLARITSSDTQAVLPPLLVFTAGVMNRASIMLKTAAASQSVIATDSVDDSIAGTSIVRIDPGPAFVFSVLDVPSSVTAGQAFSFRVRALDTFGNLATSYSGTAASSSSDARAVLPVAVTFVAGQGSASASFRTAGKASIALADGTSLSGSASSTVEPSVAATFVVSLSSVPVQAGSQIAFAATARDAFENVATGYSGSASITSSDAKASFSPQAAFVAGVARDLPVTFRTAGKQTIAATDAAVTGSASVPVQPAQATHYTVTGLAPSSIAGRSVPFSLSAFDEFENLATDYQGSAQITSSDPQATLPSPAPFTAGASGTVSIVFRTASQSQSITAADGVVTGVSRLRVDPGAAANYSFHGPSGPLLVGTTTSFSLEAHDAFGNLATSYSGNARITSSDPTATLPPDQSFANGAAFSVPISFHTAGRQTVTATDTTLHFGGETGLAILPSAGTIGSAGILEPGRDGQTATLLPNGKVLVAGGAVGFADDVSSTADTCTAEAVLYDPETETFTPTGNMNARRCGHRATVLLDGRVLMVGGAASGPFANLPLATTAEIYDSSTGTFSVTGSLATGRGHPEAVLLPDGRVLVVGGSDGFRYLSSSEIYDPSTERFSSSGSMSTARYALRAALLPSGNVLVLGGDQSVFVNLASAELYDPITGTFSPTGRMSEQRSFPTVATLRDGSVLVTGGGVVARGSLATAEIYQPTSGTFSTTGPMTVSRYGHTLTVFGSGQVLVAGGDSNGARIGTTEIFDPAAGIFSPAPAMTHDRVFHSAVLLPAGGVLLYGGLDASNHFVPNAELYNP